jgi:CheY-like chemotaxis protein/MinD-like ATPase involved in chromosome partitioning or flagellar assembly
MEKKILIVDDDFDTLHMVGKMLERHGFQIAAANNGEKAIQLAQAEKPDLIILDVMMPGMDGYEVTRQLRSVESTAFIPIILFTAKAQVDDKLEGFEAGADDYLTKPTHPAELIARVKSILTRPKTGALTLDEEPTTPGIDNVNVIGVLAAKGGLGASTVALNLAVAIHQRTKEYVTLVEARPGQGDIGLQLGYRISNAQNELLRSTIPEITVQRVEDALVTHGSGIQILLSSFNPRDAELIGNIEQMEAIIKNIRRISPHAVIDLGTGLTPMVRKILPLCNQIAVLLEPVPTTIIQSKTLLNDLAAIGMTEDRVFPVLNNRLRLEISVPNNRIQQELGREITGVIMPAPELAYQAMLRREPMINHQPDSIPSRQFFKLAEALNLAREMEGK